MGNTFYFSFEPALMQYLQELLGPGLINIFSQFSAFGEQFIIVAVMGFLYWCYDKEFGIYVGTNAVLGVVLNPFIKNIALRRRPYMDHAGITCYRPIDKTADIYNISAQGYSFPSGHSMNSAIVYGSLGAYSRKKVLTVLAFVLPFLIGLSRIVVGVHYPTDVIVGWLVGACVVIFLPRLYNAFGIEKRWIINLILFILCATGIFFCKTDDYYTGLGIMGGFYLGIEFERRFVDFKCTRNPIECIVRIAIGGIIFAAINALFKLPFSTEFLHSENTAAFLLRTARYFVALFVITGVYPMLFEKLGTFFAKGEKANS